MTQLPSVSELMISSGLPNQSNFKSHSLSNTTDTSPKNQDSRFPVSPYILPKILSQPLLTNLSNDTPSDKPNRNSNSLQTTPTDYFQNQHQHKQPTTSTTMKGSTSITVTHITPHPFNIQHQSQQIIPSYTTANHRGSIVTTPGSTSSTVPPPPPPPQPQPQQPLPPYAFAPSTYTHYSNPNQQQMNSPVTSNFSQYYYYQQQGVQPQPIPHGDPSYYNPQHQQIPQGYYYMNQPPPPPPQQQNFQNPHVLIGPGQSLPMYDENNALINKRRIIKRRTRTGCLTCRKRRIKCDERKPTCFNCERSKKVCLGYQDLLNLQPRKRNRDTSLDLPKDDQNEQQMKHIRSNNVNNGIERRNYEMMMVPAGYQEMVNNSNTNKNHSSGILPPNGPPPPHHHPIPISDQQQQQQQPVPVPVQHLNPCYVTTNPAPRVAVSDLLK